MTKILHQCLRHVEQQQFAADWMLDALKDREHDPRDYEDVLSEAILRGVFPHIPCGEAAHDYGALVDTVTMMQARHTLLKAHFSDPDYDSSQRTSEQLEQDGRMFREMEVLDKELPREQLRMAFLRVTAMEQDIQETRTELLRKFPDCQAWRDWRDECVQGAGTWRQACAEWMLVEGWGDEYLSIHIPTDSMMPELQKAQKALASVQQSLQTHQERIPMPQFQERKGHTQPIERGWQNYQQLEVWGDQAETQTRLKEMLADKLSALISEYGPLYPHETALKAVYQTCLKPRNPQFDPPAAPDMPSPGADPSF